MISDPFKLFGRLFVAGFKIIGYCAVLAGQIIWYVICRQPVRIGDAVAEIGRGIVNACAEVFR